MRHTHDEKILGRARLPLDRSSRHRMRRPYPAAAAGHHAAEHMHYTSAVPVGTTPLPAVRAEGAHGDSISSADMSDPFRRLHRTRFPRLLRTLAPPLSP